MKELVPVIHIESNNIGKALNLARININILKRAGIKKAFLISHTEKITFKSLIQIHKTLKEENPDFWLGCNFLDIPSYLVFKTIEKDLNNLDGLWIDNSYIGLKGQETKSLELFNSWKNSNFKGIYFSGVAFKGCEQPIDLVSASREAIGYMDIITTSGDRTGSAPDVEKIRKMKLAIGSKSLAIASGVSIDNIDTFLPYVDYFLTASSIEADFGIFDEDKVIKLFNKIKNYKEG